MPRMGEFQDGYNVPKRENAGEKLAEELKAAKVSEANSRRASFKEAEKAKTANLDAMLKREFKDVI